MRILPSFMTGRTNTGGSGTNVFVIVVRLVGTLTATSVVPIVYLVDTFCVFAVVHAAFDVVSTDAGIRGVAFNMAFL